MNDPSGMLQLGARFYWPEIGRFVQQDPIGDGVNWYAYAGSNPLTRTDPTGLTDCFGVIEGEIATPWGGMDVAGGFVVDDDNWLDSGFFSTGGPACGLSAGVGAGGGVVDEIEGLAHSLDINTHLLSGFIMEGARPGEEWDGDTADGIGFTVVGRGWGVATSLTQTDTLTLGNIWDGVKRGWDGVGRAGRWLRNRL